MSFSALPPVPTSGLSEAEFQLLVAITQNILLLTGQSVAANKAVITGQITVVGAPEIQASPSPLVGTLADIPNLAATLQTLISDVQSLRNTLNVLIAQLRS